MLTGSKTLSQLPSLLYTIFTSPYYECRYLKSLGVQNHQDYAQDREDDHGNRLLHVGRIQHRNGDRHRVVSDHYGKKGFDFQNCHVLDYPVIQLGFPLVTTLRRLFPLSRFLCERDIWRILLLYPHSNRNRFVVTILGVLIEGFVAVIPSWSRLVAYR